MLLIRRQGHSMIQRWQYTISRSGLVSSSSNTVCDGGTAILRPLSLYSTSTLQQNYNAPSLQLSKPIPMIKQAHIYPRHHQSYISNSLIHNCNANNQLRCWFTSGGRHTHHGGRGRGRGNGRGRGHQSTKHITGFQI
jgi:hypothetical protein